MSPHPLAAGAVRDEQALKSWLRKASLALAIHAGGTLTGAPE
jgi:hypothetical protein